MLGVWDYTFHPFGFNMFQRFHHPREDTENCQSSGSPKPQTLGSPLAGALGSDDSMLVQVAIYVWSNEPKNGLKKQNFKGNVWKSYQQMPRLSDCQTGLHLWSSFSLHHSPSQTPSPSRTWPTLEVDTTESLNPWNYHGTPSRHRWSQMLGSQLIQLIHPWYHKNS